ncbi:MAG: hypothetical protein E2O53_02690 [Gammaproteobacteria bacterium]|nr:MAG: hypothetical protein E2O53_02690 [Gammaproteobacteria bacterium]
MNRILKITYRAWVVVFSAGLPGNASSAPLFDSEDTLDVVLEAPIRRIVRQRKKESEFAGTLRYTEPSGEERALAVIVTTRGRSRLEMCDFPPLKLTFNPDETRGTLFEDQRSLKLVTRCMRTSSGTDWVYLELGIYRAFNVITENSFRARQLNITYRDTESRGRGRVQPAFILEPDHQLGKRTGRKRIRPPKVDAVQMSARDMTNNLLFQYLIGNTDFAVKRGPSGEGCCHNGRVLARPGEQRDWIIVPFDFDQSGLINTDYALPDERLPIRRVTSRLYRGFCWQNAVLPESVALFNEKRAEIEAALIPSEVSKRRARRVQKFIDRFYKTVNDPQELQEQLLDKCRGPDSLPLRESPGSPGYVKTP